MLHVNHTCIAGFYTQFTSSTPVNISKSGKRHRSRPLPDEELRTGCRLGIDSHADVHCVGRHARILEIFEGRSCNVHPFNDSYKPMKNVLTANAAFAYYTNDGQTYIINVNQALDFSESMEHSLLCPNQSRVHGVVIDDILTFLDYYNKSTHSVYFPNEDVRLPILLNGPVSYLPVRYPTDEEMDQCLHLDLSCDESPWEPMSINNYNQASSISSMTSVMDSHESSLLQDDILTNMCHIHHTISASAVSHSPTRSISGEELGRLWNIGLPTARDTIKASTQDYIRVNQGLLSRRLKTRAHQRQYHQLGGYLSRFSSDTFKMRVKSTRGNTYSQLFTNKGNYVRSYHMKGKNHSPDALDRFLHEVGIPTELMTDGAKELIHGDWSKLCRKHRITQKNTEPHSPWQNNAELMGGIVKRKLRRMMMSTGTPIRLWDYCWDYICNIISHTASGQLILDGSTPYEKVHGYTPDISELTSFHWYEWVWYHEPDDPDKFQLGR